MAQLTQGIIVAAIEGFESQKRRIDEQLAELRALSNGNAPAVAEAPKKIACEPAYIAALNPHGHGRSETTMESCERG
jgi:hypothetical protein